MRSGPSTWGSISSAPSRTSSVPTVASDLQLHHHAELQVGVVRRRLVAGELYEAKVAGDLPDVTVPVVVERAARFDLHAIDGRPRHRAGLRHRDDREPTRDLRVLRNQE